MNSTASASAISSRQYRIEACLPILMNECAATLPSSPMSRLRDTWFPRRARVCGAADFSRDGGYTMVVLHLGVAYPELQSRPSDADGGTARPAGYRARPRRRAKQQKAQRHGEEDEVAEPCAVRMLDHEGPQRLEEAADATGRGGLEQGHGLVDGRKTERDGGDHRGTGDDDVPAGTGARLAPRDDGRQGVQPVQDALIQHVGAELGQQDAGGVARRAEGQHVRSTV